VTKQLKYISIVLLLIFNNSCGGQDNSKLQIEESTNEQEIIKSIEPYQYGAGDVVFRGYLDKSGNMWFATSNEGVFKYDGKTFSNYNKEHSY